jgi:hypothetical protein
VDNELVLKVLHDITTNEAIDINDISKPWESIKEP